MVRIINKIVFIALLALICGLAALSQNQPSVVFVLIKFHKTPTASEIRQMEEQYGIAAVRTLTEIQWVKFAIPPDVDRKELIEKLKKDSRVALVEEEQPYHIQTVQNQGEVTPPAAIEILKAPPEPQPIPGRILIKFKETVQEEVYRSLLEEQKLQTVKQIPVIGVNVCTIPAEQTIEELMEELNKRPEVEYAEPDYRLFALEIPNDAYFSRQWGLHNTGQTGGTPDADIDAPEAWEKQKGSRQVLVGVVDTGIDYNHPDLQPNIWQNPGEIPNNNQDDDHNGYVDDVYGWDFVNNDANPMDDNRHGTHVAGIIGAVGNNITGISGVNWTVSLMALKFLNSQGSGSTSDAIEAIIYAANMGANILNNSWGGGGFSQALLDAINFARSKGTLFVAAAGNESRDNDQTPNYPSNYEVDNVIAVAASTDRDGLASFSNYGYSTVDLAAPGEAIYSTVPNNNYEYLSGTSMATPFVAGAAALVWAHYLPRSDYFLVKYRLFGSVDFVAGLQSRVLLDGRLNLNKAFSSTPLVAVITKPADTDDTQGPYPVRVSVISDTSITSVKLAYSFQGSVNQQDTLLMTPEGQYTYRSDLPGAPLQTTVEYRIIATDMNQNTVTTRVYSFKIGEVSPPAGCCGAFAVELDGNATNKATNASINFFLNILLIILPFFSIRLYRKLKRDD